MKWIFVLLSSFVSFSHSLCAQVILPNNYTCILSEVPGRGYGLTNGQFTFYIDAKSRDFNSSKNENDFLKRYIKTKDNLFYSTGKRSDLFFYEIVIPELFFVLSLTSTTKNNLFRSYSSQLLKAVRVNRNNDNRIFFIRQNKKECNF